MDIRTFDTYEALCAEIGFEICCALEQNPRLLICIAAGHTSIGLFDYLAEKFMAGGVNFSHAAFVSMDEWVGMSESTQSSCGHFLRSKFLSRVNFSESRIRLFNGLASDLESECRRVEDFIASNSINGVIDYLVLGTGMNGHLALNEPVADLESRAHVTSLTPLTAKVAQKYFPSQIQLTGGVTLGMANFREATRTMLMVSGSHKKEILSKILTDNYINGIIPASAIKTFANASIYCDKDAYEIKT